MNILLIYGIIPSNKNIRDWIILTTIIIALVFFISWVNSIKKIEEENKRIQTYTQTGIAIDYSKIDLSRFNK